MTQTATIPELEGDEYILKIPLGIANAVSKGGYFDRYFKYRNKGLNSKEAWSAVESDLQAYGFEGRYSSYESFRVRLSSAARAEGVEGSNGASDSFVIFRIFAYAKP
ncbi:MAG: hypothetical protein IPH04_14595 [Saprospirales bacterium]|nr:hypothetical protein [Saprospirales bacterium]